MKSKAVLTALAAFALVASPTVGAAAPAAPVPTTAHPTTRLSTPLTQREGDPVDGESTLGGRGFIVAALAVVAIGLGIYAAADSNDSPNSP